MDRKALNKLIAHTMNACKVYKGSANHVVVRNLLVRLNHARDLHTWGYECEALKAVVIAYYSFKRERA